MESYYHQHQKVIVVAKHLKRSKQTIYNVYKAF
ncbi:IS30 family transposase, partial [Vagococcus vulneris]